ncbi:MAG: UDP-N-acetylmuramoyl-tripeptide--D-alanyl-D-alanine ligase [Ruminococcus sp.]|nr:UDP-N-acetylmuramoyl-tripeptide--D-alanyl-D-alanine ligase [Ruminococcus sp.]
MKTFTLEQIALACDGQYVGSEELKDTAVSSIERDSRNIKENSLFLAIKGERVDGHDFIEKCFDSGAICALCEKAPENASKPYILVESTLDAVKKIAKAYRELFDIPIVGISGSVGKTSTKEMIASVLSAKYKVHKTAGNLNNELGVPLTLFGMDDTTEVAVIEMGISDFGEMNRISEMVQPTIEVITIIGECHLENLGDRDGVFRAKTEMFKNLRDGGSVVLNCDDDKLSQVIEVKGKAPVFYGEESNSYRAENIENNGVLGVKADLILGENRLSVTIPAIGTYMVSNALAGAAVGELLGLNLDEIKRGIESYKTVGSRANLIDTEYIRIIDDCYNANPTSVKASIDTLMNFEGRKVAVLGDMKELGENEKQLHFEVGEYAKKCDVVVAIGPLAEELAKGADGIYLENREAAMVALQTIIQRGDVVLVKASHSMQFEKIVDFLKELKCI